MTALPAGVHPVTVRSCFTTADDALILAAVPVSPARWIASGGAPEPVAALAKTLGERLAEHPAQRMRHLTYTYA